MEHGLLDLVSSIVFLVSLLAVGWSLFFRSRRLEIDDRGILDRSLGLGRIRWEEIEGAYQGPRSQRDSVFLRLRPTDRVLRRLRGARPPAPRSADAPVDVRLDLSDAELTPFEIVREIVARGGREER
jgi:hypothetical protein